MKANEESLVLWSLLLGPNSAPEQPEAAQEEGRERPGFLSDSCSSFTCRIMSSLPYHMAEPVLPLIPFTLVLSLKECLGMIHPPSHGAGSHLFHYLTLLAASGR